MVHSGSTSNLPRLLLQSKQLSKTFLIQTNIRTSWSILLALGMGSQQLLPEHCVGAAGLGLMLDGRAHRSRIQ